MSEAANRDALADSTEYAKKFTAPATQEVVVAAGPGAGKRWIIDFLWINGDAAGTLQLLDSDNAAIDGYFFTFAGSGGICIEKAYLEKLTLDRGLKFTTTGGGNYAVIIKYHGDLAR